MTYRSLPIIPIVWRTLRKRLYLLLPILVVPLLLLQPLWLHAKPATRGQAQIAELAQATPATQNEGQADPNPNIQAQADDDATAEATSEATPTPTLEPTVVDQANFPSPTASSTDIIAIEIPNDTNAEPDGTYTLSPTWQGNATIAAAELARVAPPLYAEVIQGDFQITYVGTEETPSLRILPVAATDALGSVRLGIQADLASLAAILPVGEVLSVQVSARVYASDATTRLLIADDAGSSSVAIDGLNWNDYQTTRRIAPNTESVGILVEWLNVPANGWLEIRGITLTTLSTGATLSPTDTPVVIEAVAIEPTAPIPATPTPPAMTIATATPIPDHVAATGDEPALPDVSAETSTEVDTEVDGSAAITETEILTPTPTLIVVTSTPTPVDVYQEATRVAQATEWARVLGPATATPPNLATPTPTITPIIVTNTPLPANEATAISAAIHATAVAFTTGTPTPLPPDAIVLVATATEPPPTATPRDTNTPTPVFVLLDDIPVVTPTPPPPVPAILHNKIVFLTSYRGNPNQPNAMVMNPDGTEVGLLTTNYFYNIAAERDAYSADQRFRAYALREAGGAAHNAGRTQIFYDDMLYSSTQHQLTYFGAGVAWKPSWSPRSETVAFVSSESGNDEIWIVERNQWPPTQLTKNDWEWDHHPSFSLDGSEIVFSSNRVTGRRQIWMMSSSGEDQRQLTNFTFEAWNPVWVKYVDEQ